MGRGESERAAFGRSDQAHDDNNGIRENDDGCYNDDFDGVDWQRNAAWTRRIGWQCHCDQRILRWTRGRTTHH